LIGDSDRATEYCVLGVWWLVPGRSRNGSSTLWILRRLVTHQLIHWLFEHQSTLKQSEGDPLLLPSKTYILNHVRRRSAAGFSVAASRSSISLNGSRFCKSRLLRPKDFPRIPHNRTECPYRSQVDPGALSQSTGHRWRVTARLLAWQWLEKIRVRQTPALPPQ
jgi:hypothetical protein